MPLPKVPPLRGVGDAGGEQENRDQALSEDFHLRERYFSFSSGHSSLARINRLRGSGPEPWTRRLTNRGE
jgi:hypothetical protein